MEERDLSNILAGKQRRRHELARLPIEEKLRAVVRLQELAAPILRLRGKTVRCWKLQAPSGAPKSCHSEIVEGSQISCVASNVTR
jgi:hypothetical protein